MMNETKKLNMCNIFMYKSKRKNAGRSQKEMNKTIYRIAMIWLVTVAIQVFQNMLTHIIY